MITEGFPEGKAQELTIEKSVEVCRNSAHSDIVKSVLASSKFNTSKEVIAKFITETDTNRAERQVLALRKFQSQNKRGGFNNSVNSSRGRFNNNNRGNYYNQNTNYNQNNGQNNRYHGNGNNHGQNNRGNGPRGGYRNNTRGNAYGNNNQQPRYNNHNQNGYTNIRVTQSVNGEDPRQMNMGAPAMLNQQQH